MFARLAQRLPLASVAVVLAALGCVAQQSPQARQVEISRRQAITEKQRAAGNVVSSDAGPPDSVLAPVTVDQEIVVSIGTTFVVQNSNNTTDDYRIVGSNGDLVTIRHTTSTGLQPEEWTYRRTGDVAPSPAVEIVQVPAGQFRCTRSSVNTVPDTRSTVWTWVDLPVPLKHVGTLRGFPYSGELVRVENATLTSRQGARGHPNAPGSVTLGVKVDEDAGEGRGVSVIDVIAGTPAERAGMEPGDLIERVDGEPVPDLKTLHRTVASSSARTTVLVLRRGKEIELSVALPEKPAEPAAAAAPAPPPKVEAPAQTGDTYVLAIGVNEYDDARIPKLHFAEQDARALYGFFATSRKSPTSQDRVLLLAGKDAKRNAILRAIREHLERKATRPEDTVILYFGGHGFSDADDTYLAAQDTQIDALPETGLSSATLREYWSKIRAGRKVLIMDACHSGGIENMRGTRGVSGVKITGGPGAEPPNAATPATTLVIAATGPNELSTEDPNLGHGVFTRVLLNGLAGEADENKDGHVSADELARYLQSEVPNVARGFGGNQTPVVNQTSGGPTIFLTR
jgi:hypothetical protein